MEAPNQPTPASNPEQDKATEQRTAVETANDRLVRDLFGRIDVKLSDVQRGELAALILAKSANRSVSVDSLNKALNSASTI